MAKNIVICADGTGNTTIKGRGTNVFKLYEAVDQNGHRLDPQLVRQVALYHDGVGTESIKWFRILSGATGWGLSRNVKQLYRELARVYETGDKIFLFGFSRGAFTVRTLAGFITTCGILDPTNYATNKKFRKAVRAAYGLYRTKYQTRVSLALHGRVQIDPVALRTELRSNPPLEHANDKTIEFIGVWDTVDAVGLPILAADVINSTFYRFKFTDRALSPQVRHACHAVALDEERESFAPVLWDQKRTAEDQTIEQVWFAGVHSNVGGGYPRQGMSLVALNWMMAKAEAHGLRFISADREAYRLHADVDDKMYDSRRGFGIFYRWQPRDVEALCQANGVRPTLHRSIFERVARSTEDYAPGSIPPAFIADSVTVARPVLSRLEGAVAGHFRNPEPMSLIRKERGWVKTGRLSYWLFVYAILTFAVIVLIDEIRTIGSVQSRWDVVRRLVGDIMSARWLNPLATALWEHPLLTAFLTTTFGTGLGVDAHLDRTYSGFWHSLRKELREILSG